MTTELKVVRSIFTSTCTIGRLYFGDLYTCFTLEDVCREDLPGSWRRDLKVPAATAIPYGRYEVIINFSQRFQKPMPLLLGVPDFEGVRIHPGNTDKDTEGCILVGQNKAADNLSILNSKFAFDQLFPALQIALQRGKVYVTITKES